MAADRLRSPGWAHLPGRTAGADQAPLDAAVALVPERFVAPVEAANRALRYGLELCDGGFYWEAHEVLEAVWWASAPNGRERHALRALIQIANAGLKLRMERPRAALRLFREARELLGSVGPPGATARLADALDADGLAREVEICIECLEAGERPRCPVLRVRVRLAK